MVKFAPVCPIQIYEKLDQIDPGCLGDYFLLLAHDVLDPKYQKRYADFFSNRDCTIIMDNSVIELGTSCNAANLLEACQIVNATCVVMPDVLQDGTSTLKSTDRFLNDWHALPSINRNFQKMFVPQGSMTQDYIACVQNGFTLFASNIDWIGIARNVTGRIVSTRGLTVSLIIREASLRKLATPKIHLLGYSHNLNDDFGTARIFKDVVSGIDSAVPLRLGMQGRSIVALAQMNWNDPGPRGDWWEEAAVYSGMTLKQMADNLRETHKLLGKN